MIAHLFGNKLNSVKHDTQKVFLLHGPVIFLLGIYLNKIALFIYSDILKKMFKAVLFTVTEGDRTV